MKLVGFPVGSTDAIPANFIQILFRLEITFDPQDSNTLSMDRAVESPFIVGCLKFVDDIPPSTRSSMAEVEKWESQLTLEGTSTKGSRL